MSNVTLHHYSDWIPNIAGWTLLSSITGSTHALSTGRRVVPNTLLFALYGGLMASSFYTIRQTIFGDEMNHFPNSEPNQPATKPIHWDICSAALTGVLAGMISGNGHWASIFGAVGFATFATATRIGYDCWSHWMTSPTQKHSWAISLPRWSPIQMRTHQEHQAIISEHHQVQALEDRVQTLRFQVQVKKRIRELDTSPTTHPINTQKQPCDR